MILSKLECERINVLEYFVTDLALVLRIPVLLQELLLEVDGSGCDRPQRQNSSTLLNRGKLSP